MRTLYASVGQTPPPLAISVENPVPLGRGLGGSAAGAALGLAIAAALRDPEPTIDELTRTITVLEGHPDNGVPAIVGGIVVAVSEGEDVVYARFDAPAELQRASRRAGFFDADARSAGDLARRLSAPRRRL